MKYRIKILEVLSTIREIEAPNVDAAIAKAENMYVKGEVVLELETNSITVIDDKEEKMKFLDEYDRLKATLEEEVCLLILHYGHWYAFGSCAKDAIRSDPSIPLWRKSGAMEYLIHRDDEAWLCSFLAKMVTKGRSVALAEDRGDGYKVTRVIRPGGAE